VSNPGLQERELIKFSALASALAGTLHQRGVSEPAATLAAEAGIVILKVAFESWVSDDNGRDLSSLIRESLDELKTMIAATSLPTVGQARWLADRRIGSCQRLCVPLQRNSGIRTAPEQH